MNDMSLPKSHTQWEIEPLITQLRQLRLQSLEKRNRRGRPAKLPSKKTLGAIVNQLCTALFPNRLGARYLSEEAVDYFVGYTLDRQLSALNQQISLELKFFNKRPLSDSEIAAQTKALTRDFAAQLPDVRQLIETDIQAAFEGDPAARSPDEILVCYPGITAILHYRLAHMLYNLGLTLTARIISKVAHSLTGIDIHPGAKIGSRFFIDHGTGVVIGETAVIGAGVRLYQAVTLGAKRFVKDDNGWLAKGQDRHPIVEDNVVIYAGATLLGRITIGQGSVIGGNVWLTHSVPPGSQISQAQIRQEMFEGGGGI